MDSRLIACVLAGICWQADRLAVGQVTTQPTTIPTQNILAGTIDQRSKFLALQLASVELSLDAINAAIIRLDPQKARNLAAAEKAQRANEDMDRMGGGPVRWQAFYGRTAKVFYGDRPVQFDYIYKANAETMQKAIADVVALGEKRETLLLRRNRLEAEQINLWSKLVFRCLALRDIADKPLCRFELKPSVSDIAAVQRVAAMRAMADFVRLSVVQAEEIQQVSVEQQGRQFVRWSENIRAARRAMSDNLLLQQTVLPELNKEGASLCVFMETTKRLAESLENIAEAYLTAIEGDVSKDNQRKTTARALLQESLVEQARCILLAFDNLTTLSRDWKVEPDYGRPLVLAEKKRDNAVNPDGHRPESVEPRLEGGSQAADAKRDVATGPTNLLASLDLKRDVVWGMWQMADGTLTSDTGQCSRLEFPCELPAEYDYKVVLSRRNGNDCAYILGYAARRQFIWAIGAGGNTVTGFPMEGRNNPTNKRFSLTNGKQYTCILKVRRDSIQGFVNGELVSQLKADFQKLSWPDFMKLKHDYTVGLGSYCSSVEFYSADITPVGPGE